MSKKSNRLKRRLCIERNISAFKDKVVRQSENERQHLLATIAKIVRESTTAGECVHLSIDVGGGKMIEIPMAVIVSVSPPEPDKRRVVRVKAVSDIGATV